MRIRILRPTAVRLELAPGDELVLTQSSIPVEQMLAARRIDGERVAQLIEGDDEVADRVSVEEQAIRVRGRGQRPSSVS
jgi:hypothetical protein